MRISKLPLDLYQLLESLSLTKPKQCFSNCLLAVLNMDSNIYPSPTYVLCDVTYLGKTLPHAVIKYENQYFDPTLEAQGYHELASYESHWECNKDQLIKMLFEKFGKHDLGLMLNGQKAFWPLVLNENGKPYFVDA